MKSLPTKIASLLALGLCLSVPGRAQTFTNGTGDGLYYTAGNWSGGAVPNLTTSNTATIGGGLTATDTGSGGDLLISNGGVLEVTTGGTWTQSIGNNYIQLQGGGTILVDGGTFNQGTASSNPFNIGGTGNAFTISGGTANFDLSVNLSYAAGVLNWNQTGGTVNITGNSSELNLHNGSSMNITGNVNLADLMNINGTGGINFGGGTFYDGAANYDGWYAPQSNGFNFTGTSGTLEFNNNNLSEVQGWVNAGDISYNGTTDATKFAVSQAGSVISVSLIPPVEVPEPSTYAMMSAGLLTLLGVLRRRAHKLAV